MMSRYPLWLALFAALFLVAACQTTSSSSLAEKRVVKFTIPGCS